MKKYEAIAIKLQAIKNCIKSNNSVWLDKHQDDLDAIMQTAPSGSGFDNGTVLDESRTDDKRMVFHVGFHHMNEAGYYICWTTHEVWVYACFSGFDIRVTGKNKNNIKEYIGDVFYEWLNEEVTP